MAPPVFVLSCERSGSTLLRYLLDTHPEVCAPGEVSLGALCSNLRVTLARTIGLTMGPTSSSDLHCRRIVSGIMNTYARAKGKRIWCDKTPMNVAFLETLESVFPDARYVVLFRDCMDVVHSCLELGRYGFMPELAQYVARNPQNLVAALVESWVEKTSTLVKFRERASRTSIDLKYEALVRNPEKEMRRVLQFLGLEWEPGLTQHALSIQHDRGGGDPKIDYTRRIETGSVGKGRALPQEGLPEGLRGQMNALLQRVGYGAAEDEDGALTDRKAEAQGTRAHLTDVRDVFCQHIPARLKENVRFLGVRRARVSFLIDGPEKNGWTVEWDGAEGRVIEGSRESDCTISTCSEVILGIANGNVNAVTAYMEGRIQVQGDKAVLQSIGLLF